jgi:hypothetical protein
MLRNYNTATMKNILRLILVFAFLAPVVHPVSVIADPPSPNEVKEKVFDLKTPSNPNHIVLGGRGVQKRSIVAGVCSLIIPGVGQAINKNKVGKIVVHAVIGLVGIGAGPVTGGWGYGLGIFHLWSGWDALIDRPGGYINQLVDTPVQADGPGVC